MNIIGERIRYLRKERLEKTQKDFGSQIGLKSNSVSDIENGKNNPTEQTIMAICREFGVNEEWLRNGIEPMYKEKDGSFTELLSDLDDSEDDFIKNLITVYMGLDKESKDALRKIADGMAEKYKRRD